MVEKLHGARYLSQSFSVEISVESVVNLELNKICEWLIANKITLDVKKTDFITFRPSKNS